MSYFRKLSFRFACGIFAIALSGLVGCSDFYPVENESPVKSDFVALAEDARVLYKQGMREQALLVQSVLDEQIERIEKVHGKPFVNQSVVHLCDTQECFAEYTGIDSGILAAVSSNGLFLKSYVITHEDYSSWLAHELSHFIFVSKFRPLRPALFLRGIRRAWPHLLLMAEEPIELAVNKH